MNGFVQIEHCHGGFECTINFGNWLDKTQTGIGYFNVYVALDHAPAVANDVTSRASNDALDHAPAATNNVTSGAPYDSIVPTTRQDTPPMVEETNRASTYTLDFVLYIGCGIMYICRHVM